MVTIKVEVQGQNQYDAVNELRDTLSHMGYVREELSAARELERLRRDLHLAGVDITEVRRKAEDANFAAFIERHKNDPDPQTYREPLT